MAPYKGFVGGTYTGQSATPAADRCINWYPELTTGAGAPESNIIFLPTPGLSVFATLPGASVDALYADPVTNRCFAISGGNFYEVLSGGTISSSYGTVGSGPYSFASANSGQIMISANGIGFLFNITGATNSAGTTLTANTLYPILTLADEFMGSSQCAAIDDYFITLVPNSREFQISTLLDGSQWDGLDFGAASGGPDNIVAFSASHRELWLFSQRRVEIYIDDGSANFPFDRLEGTYLETGCAAAQSVVRMDNTLYWVGQDERGSGVVWCANGYTPQRISTHGVEYFLSEYIKNGGISDVQAFAYQDVGHSFYVLHFPSATCDYSPNGAMTTGVVKGATWVFDRATNQWHERQYWNQTTGQAQAHLGRCHTYAFGKHLVGDYQSGNIYVLSPDNYDDNGQFIQRIRRAPHLANELKRMFHHSLEIDMQTGTGNANDPNPVAALRISNDGGLTWGNPRTASLGTAGNYQTRVRWQMLGMARRRAYEFSTTARVPAAVVDAYLEVTPGIG